jgi:hypothetical protein
LMYCCRTDYAHKYKAGHACHGAVFKTKSKHHHCVVAGATSATATRVKMITYKEEVFYFRQGCRIADHSQRTPDLTRDVSKVWYSTTSSAWSGLKKRDHFSVRWTGPLSIKTSGKYRFYLRSDDGSKLWIDSRPVVNNDGCHGMRKREATTSLTPGDHPLRIEFFENGGGAGCEFQFKGPDTKNQWSTGELVTYQGNQWLDLTTASATQSSTAYGGYARRGIDGSASTNYRSRSCTHTHQRQANWWEVDLGSIQNVKEIAITNRGDCCGSRLSPFSIRVGSSLCAQNVKIAQGETKIMKCEGVGQKVRVENRRGPRRSVPGPALTICEFRVAVGPDTATTTTTQAPTTTTTTPTTTTPTTMPPTTMPPTMPPTPTTMPPVSTSAPTSAPSPGTVAPYGSGGSTVPPAVQVKNVVKQALKVIEELKAQAR